MTLDESRSTFPEGPPENAFRFSIPEEAKVQIALSEAILDSIPNLAQTLLWVTDWPLYKEHEMAVLMRIRASYGESRTLIKAPGHILDKADRSILAGMLFLMQAFGWDSYFICPTAQSILFTSHHDLLEVITRSARFAKNIGEIATRFGIDGK